MDSVSFPQLNSEFNDLTYVLLNDLSQVSILCIRQIPIGLWRLYTEFEDGRRNLRILLLKLEKLSDFLRKASKLRSKLWSMEKKSF